MRGRALRRAKFALTFELWKVFSRLTGGVSFRRKRKKKTWLLGCMRLGKNRLLIEMKLVL